MKPTVSVVILTFNEDKHIARAIRSVTPFADQVIVIDSGSSDKTVGISRGLGALVLQHPWESHAKQFNWALENASITGTWVMRLDADEYATEGLAEEINRRLPLLAADVVGVYIRRRVYFMNRWIKHGGVYPSWLLRMWRFGHGRCENRLMDEHTMVWGGRVVQFAGELVDENLNDLTWWTEKHNRYAVREVADLLNLKYKLLQIETPGGDGDLEQPRLRRALKEGVYARMPLFLRPGLYFWYRYVFRLGFLDGIPGLLWHVLQGFWYRFLVDAKMWEAERWASTRDDIQLIVDREWHGTR